MKKGWEVKKLGEVCQVQLGKTPYRKNPKFWDKEKTSNNIWLSIADLKHGEYISNSAEHVSDLGAKDIVKIPQGTMLLSFKLTLGRVSFAGTDLYTNEAIAALLHLDNILSKEFLFYYFSFFNWDKAAEGDIKIKGKTLNKQKLKELPILVPPLAEQKRIVAILDEVFAAIDKAKANSEKNLANAKELFESYLNGIFKNSDWNTVEFADVITTLTDYHANGSYKNLKENVELKEQEDYAWMIRSTDFENNFQNDFRYIDEKAYEFLEKSKVFGRELIMSKIGNAGNVYLVPQLDRPCSLAMNLFLIRVDEKKTIPEFQFQYLKTFSGEIQIQSRLKGATTKTITKENVRSIIVPLPPIKVQQDIIKKIEELSAETNKLESIYQTKISDFKDLKKSILRKAFEGGL